LSHLSQLPLDEIKIDRSFIANLSRDPVHATLARTVMTLGKGLGLSVIAEGVETASQFNVLQEFGYHEMQGKFLAAPLSGDALEQILKDQFIGPKRANKS